MRPEVKRILKLVEDGKLSAEDAAELIEAFDDGKDETPPPPPKSEAGTETDTKAEPTERGPFQDFIEAIERLSKDVTSKVDWQLVAKQIKEGAHKGVEAVKSGVEQVSRGRIDFGWISGTEVKEVELPLVIPAGKTLKIDNPCGNVSIKGGTGAGTVSARAKFKAANVEDAREKAANYVLMIEESDGAVLIRQPDMSGLEVDLTIRAPEDAPLDVKTASGDITVEFMKAGVKINGKSGDVHLRTIEGPIEIATASGDVSVEDAVTPTFTFDGKSGDVSLKRVHGNANIRTASGDVSVTGGNARTISIECVSGDCEVEVDDPVVGSLSVRTVSGDVLVKIPSGSDCRVSVSTLRGDATVRATLDDEAKADQRVTGKLGDGNGSVEISAVTGDVTLETV